MWKGLGSLKTGLNDITSKTISSVAKAGNRAKELINQIDHDEFFDQELNDNDSNILKNPLDNPLVKLDGSKAKKKDGTSKSEKEDGGSSKGNSLNQLPTGEDLQDIPPVNLNNALPKIYSTKKQKAQDGSSSPRTNSKKKNNKTGVSQDLNQQADGGEAVKKSKVEDDVIPAQTENTRNEQAQASEKEKKGKKGKAPSNIRELEELRNELNERDEALERFAIDNDQLLKERNEVKALANSYQDKISNLDKHLSEVLGKKHQT